MRFPSPPQKKSTEKTEERDSSTKIQNFPELKVEFPKSKIPAQRVKIDQLRSVCEISEQHGQKDSARPERRGSVILKIKNRNIFGFNINSGSWKEGNGAVPSEFLRKMPNLRLYT